jgi:hypothetical protein
MSKHPLAEQLQRDQVLATRTRGAHAQRAAPRSCSRVHQAIHDGTGYVDLRVRIDTGETEIVLVPADGSDSL